MDADRLGRVVPLESVGHGKEEPPRSLYLALVAPYPEKSLNLLSKRSAVRKFAVLVTSHRLFQNFILCVILANCVTLALSSGRSGFDATPLGAALSAIDLAYLVIFAVEMLLKIVAMGFMMERGTYLRDGWNVLDFVVVLMGFVNLATPSNLTGIRTVRALRPLRTVNRIKGMKVIVTTMIGSLPLLLDVFVLCAFCFFMFGIIAVQLFAGALRFRCGVPDFSGALNVTGSVGATTIQNVTYSVPEEQRDETCSGPLTSEVSWYVVDGEPVPYGGTVYGGRTCPEGMFCTMYGNPSFGLVSYDNIMWAWLTIFQHITMSSWTDAMYWTQDAVEYWVWLFYVGLVIFGAFFMVNLALAVLSINFSADNLEAAKEAEEKEGRDRHWAVGGVEVTPPEPGGPEPPNARIAHKQQREEDEEEVQTGSPPPPGLGRIRQLAWRVAVSKQLEYGTAALIVINTIVMCINWYDMPSDVEQITNYINYALTIYFLVELLIKLTGFSFRRYFREGMNTFDALVVAISMVELLMDLIPSVSGLGPLSVLRAFRLLRIFRLARSWKELNLIIRGMFRSLQASFMLVLLMLLFLFIAAVVGMQLFGYKFMFCEYVDGAAPVCPLGMRIWGQCPNHFHCFLPCTPADLDTWIDAPGSFYNNLAYCERFCTSEAAAAAASDANATSADVVAAGGCDYLAMVGKSEVPRANFDNIFWGLYTVFQLLTGENWNDVMFASMLTLSHWASLYYVGVIVIGNYLVFNLFIAILLDNLSFTDELANGSRSAKGGKPGGDKSGHGGCHPHQLGACGSSSSVPGHGWERGAGAVGSARKIDGIGSGFSVSDASGSGISGSGAAGVPGSMALLVPPTPSLPLLPGGRGGGLERGGEGGGGGGRAVMLNGYAAKVYDNPLARGEDSSEEEEEEEVEEGGDEEEEAVDASFQGKLKAGSAPTANGGSDPYSASDSAVPSRGKLRPLPVALSSRPSELPSLSTGLPPPLPPPPQLPSLPASLSAALPLMPSLPSDVRLPPLGGRSGLLPPVRAAAATRGGPNLEASGAGGRQAETVPDVASLSPAPAPAAAAAAPPPPIAAAPPPQPSTAVAAAAAAAAPTTTITASAPTPAAPSTHSARGPGPVSEAVQRPQPVSESIGKAEPGIVSAYVEMQQEVSPRQAASLLGNGHAASFSASETPAAVAAAAAVAVLPGSEAGAGARAAMQGAFGDADDADNMSDAAPSLQRSGPLPAPPAKAVWEEKLAGRSLLLFPPDSRLRIKAAHLVYNRHFETTILVLIIASCICLILDSPNLDPKSKLADVLHAFDYIFISAFTIEAVLKVIAFGFAFTGSHAYLRSGWNVLDFLIVLVGYTLIIVDAIGVEASNLKTLRVLRALRALRPLRAANRFEGLRVVVNTLFAVAPAMANVALVCLLFYLIFAILSVNLFKGELHNCVDAESGDRLDPEYILRPGEVLTRHWCQAGVQQINASFYHNGRGIDSMPPYAIMTDWINPAANFDNVGVAILTLFQVATLSLWVDIMFSTVDATAVDQQPVWNHQPLFILYFVFIIIIISFVVLNLFIGVTLDKFAALQAEQHRGGLLLTPPQQAWVDLQRLMLRSNLHHKPPRPPGRVRRAVHRLVTSLAFEWGVMAAILVNVAFMAMVHADMSLQWQKIMSYSNLIFTSIFLLEALLKVSAFGPINYVRDGWNAFDFFVVLISIASVVLDLSNTKNLSFMPALRVLRVVRVLRLIRSAKGMQKLLLTLINSLPALANVGGVMLLFFFIYAIIGVSLFSNLKYGDSLDRHANFDTFFNAMLLLFRVLTGESWNAIMIDCMGTTDCVLVTAPGGISATDPLTNVTITVPAGEYLDPKDPLLSDQPSGATTNQCAISPAAAVIYFPSFVILCTLILLQLVIAVLLDNLSQTDADATMPVPKTSLDSFVEAWSEVDGHATGLIHASQLTAVVMASEPPLGTRGSAEFRLDAQLLLQRLDIPLYPGNKVCFIEVLHALSGDVCGAELPDAAEDTVRAALSRRLPPTAPLPRYTAAHYHAADNVRAAVKGFLLRYRHREELADESFGRQLRLMQSLRADSRLQDADRGGVGGSGSGSGGDSGEGALAGESGEVEGAGVGGESERGSGAAAAPRPGSGDWGGQQFSEGLMELRVNSSMIVSASQLGDLRKQLALGSRATPPAPKTLQGMPSPVYLSITSATGEADAVAAPEPSSLLPPPTSQRLPSSPTWLPDQQTHFAAAPPVPRSTPVVEEEVEVAGGGGRGRGGGRRPPLLLSVPLVGPLPPLPTAAASLLPRVDKLLGGSQSPRTMPSLGADGGVPEAAEVAGSAEQPAEVQ